jgi:hypothetical protein
MHMLITALIFWHHTIRRISFKAVALIGLIAFVFLNVYGMMRESKYDSLSDVVRKNENSFELLQVTGGTYDAATYTLTTGEFAVPFETFPQMIKSVGPDIFPKFGFTYLRSPLFFIPSVLFPSRPEALGNWYMKQFYGSGWGLNEGRAFYFLSEGYLNFGPAGVLAIMVVWGAALGAIHHYIRTAKSEPGAVLLYALSLAYIPAVIAGEFVSVLVGLPEQYLIAAILGIWLTGRKRSSFRAEAVHS